MGMKLEASTCQLGKVLEQARLIKRSLEQTGGALSLCP